MPVVLYLYSCLLSYVLLFSYLLCYLVFLSAVVFTVIYAHGFFCTSCIPPLHTHSLWSRSDDPGFARPDIGRLFYCAGVRRDYSSCEGLDALSSISGISPLYILSFPDSAFIAFSCHFLVIIHLLSSCCYYMYYCSDH